MIGCAKSTRLAVAFLLLAATATGTLAADQIQPDRPEVTESARLIPRGTAQLETGFLYSSQWSGGTRW